MKAITGRRLLWALFLPLLGIGALALSGTVPEELRLLPAGLSLLAWAAFQASLRRNGTPLVERFASRHYSPMPDRVRRYCRRVTWAWAALLFGNAAVSIILARWGSLEAWMLYTGLISYLLLGAMALGERFSDSLAAPPLLTWLGRCWRVLLSVVPILWRQLRPTSVFALRGSASMVG